MKPHIYDTLGLKRVINASGRMTVLGVSTIQDTVGEAMVEAAQSYVWMDDLYRVAGERIAKHAGAQGGVVTSCASAGIALSVAGIIAKDSLHAIRMLPDTQGLPNEIILLKGHVIQFGAPVTSMIRLGGGIPVEAGLANEASAADVAALISNRTAGILYVKSHHTVQKGMASLESLIEVAKRHNIPLIVDAAAEEDLKRYIALGADLVIYSGSKAFEGPTSGFVVGNKPLTEYVYAQYKGVGRPMKIGKEGIVGLLTALDNYAMKSHKQAVALNLEYVHKICDALSNQKGITVNVKQDEAGREIYRVELNTKDKRQAVQLKDELESGSPAIYCRGYRADEGCLYFDTRPLSSSDVDVLIQRIKEILGGF